MRARYFIILGLAFFGSAWVRDIAAQSSHATAADAAPPRTADPAIHRLILKDGSYQVVTKWQVTPAGDRIRYISAERGGDWEEVPMTLMDWAATRKYAREHSGNTPPAADEAADSAGQQSAAAIDAEEKADRERNLVVAPNLVLPSATGIWALDTYHDEPELVDLEQNTVNPRTGHNIVHSPLSAAGVTKQNIELNERHAKPAIHDSVPTFYVSLDSAADEEGGSDALTVDTHGAGSQKGPESGSSPDSRYVIIHADVRKDFRFVGQVRINAFGTSSTDTNVILTDTQVLPGKHWLKVTAREPIVAGDYVLMEVLSPKEVNLAVWDFRIDPRAGDNENAILPLQRK